MPEVDIEDIVRVVNTGPQPIEIGWDSKVYRLDPNKDSFVPAPAVFNAFGDPRSAETIVSLRNQHGQVGWVPDRATEVRRLRAKYDNQAGDEASIANHPAVEVYTLDGERITTVLEDPSGRSTIAAAPTVAAQDDLLAVVKKQQAQIDLLLENMATPIPGEPAAASEPFGTATHVGWVPGAEPQEDTAVSDLEVRAQPPQDHMSLPPEDTGGDFARPPQTERSHPEPGAPGVDWGTLGESTE